MAPTSKISPHYQHSPPFPLLRRPSKPFRSIKNCCYLLEFLS
ncbi:hypothetical protein CCACVL1_00840, partial [Corchorus capsularis]